VEDAQSRGSLLGFAAASHMRAVAILLRGRVPDAAKDARQALAVEPRGWRLGAGGARAVLANCLLERGDLVGAERHLTTAGEMTGEHDVTRLSLLSTRARLRLTRGDAEAALADFLAAGELGERAGAANPVLAPWRSGAALAHTALGNPAEGMRLAEAELALSERFGAPGPIGRALRTIGMIRGPESGLEALEASAHCLESSQAALERARSMVEFGAALRRSGRRRDARAPLAEGLDLARRCGADALAERAQQEARVAGARPRRTAVSGLEALTARELQVARLAANGRSNREIAEALVVTVKTVEWHLKHSFRKLGVDSRQKLSRLLADTE
jgi:ATP/maltotriose-dependent transcriptional regulator MalT